MPLAAVMARPTQALVPAPEPAPAPGGTLVVHLIHRFERATVFVRIDVSEVAREALAGRGGKSCWSRNFAVPAGRRRIEIRVAGDGVDSIDGTDIDVPRGGRCEVTGSLSLMTHRLKVRPSGADGEGR